MIARFESLHLILTYLLSSVLTESKSFTLQMLFMSMPLSRSSSYLFSVLILEVFVRFVMICCGAGGSGLVFISPRTTTKDRNRPTQNSFGNRWSGGVRN